MAFDDLYGFQGYRVAIGPSSILGVTSIPYQSVITVKHFGGFTLEIGGATLSWGNGYVMSTLETKDMDARGTFYLCQSGNAGVTAIIHLFRAGTNSDLGT